MSLLVIGGGESFAPSAMRKSGAAWAGLDESWRLIPTWIADPDYPGSEVSVSGDGLVVQEGKIGATLAASVAFTGHSSLGADVTLRLRVNDSTVAVTGVAKTCPEKVTTTVTVSGTYTVATGDVITLQALGDWAFNNQNPSIAAGAAAFVRVT
ncbi:hypothetical protein JK358_00885 [Nocardia sp. 2]|uniref:Htaa domain-containing protein n=1 Tax=Nocardia acididurans TaxID=2802282 RepID=A0ABS1LXM5_9NOCA|nr:hypothetical protein [Nocardia acididurans]MBL1072944.1 hypothetical protein [Nocardia acididurans]